MKYKLNEYEIQIDRDELWRLKEYKYTPMKTISGKVYIIRNARINNKTKRILIHREIMNCPDGLEVDHRYGDTLDLRKSKMHNCSHAENIRNQKLNKNNTSGFKGVSWDKTKKLWIAAIKVGDKKIKKRCKSKEKAHEIYKELAIKYHGEYATY